MDGPLLPPPSTYLDFNGLTSLKGQAHASRPEAKAEAARQFETMFIQMMMKSMRAATPRGELLESPAMDTYQDLFDKEIANQMGRRGALGIASMLERQLSHMPRPAGEVAGQRPEALASQPVSPADRGLPLNRSPATATFLPGQRQPRSLALPPAPGKGYPLNRTLPALGTIEPDQAEEQGRTR
jgi:Rod binding domain-containing protein